MIPYWLGHRNINRDTLGSHFVAAISKLRHFLSSSTVIIRSEDDLFVDSSICVTHKHCYIRKRIHLV